MRVCALRNCAFGQPSSPLCAGHGADQREDAAVGAEPQRRGLPGDDGKAEVVARRLTLAIVSAREPDCHAAWLRLQLQIHSLLRTAHLL